MASIARKKVDWHLEILPKSTSKALDLLSKQNWLKKSPWYLAGGTALALQCGNRQSVDLDFFTENSDFNTAKLLGYFSKLPWQSHIIKEGTVYGKLLGAKISFIAYPFFKPKKKALWYGSIRILEAADIAVMKLIAISQRGRKRDFYDLYWYANNVEGLEKIIYRVDKQYPKIVHDYHHFLKSLVYFVDAEQDPTPKIFFNVSWRQVKDFFEMEARHIAKYFIY